MPLPAIILRVERLRSLDGYQAMLVSDAYKAPERDAARQLKVIKRSELTRP